MANETMTLISTVTVGSGGAGNITFSSIPQTYTDLYLVASSRINYAGISAGFYANFNSDFTGGNYVRRFLSGDGSSAPTSVTSNAVIHLGSTSGNNATANTFGNTNLYIPNYTASTYKSASSDGVSENNGTTAYQVISAGIWNSTAAINSIVIYSDGGSLMQYSTASLYGILKGSGGATVS